MINSAKWENFNAQQEIAIFLSAEGYVAPTTRLLWKRYIVFYLRIWKNKPLSWELSTQTDTDTRDAFIRKTAHSLRPFVLKPAAKWSESKKIILYLKTKKTIRKKGGGTICIIVTDHCPLHVHLKLFILKSLVTVVKRVRGEDHLIVTMVIEERGLLLQG